MKEHPTRPGSDRRRRQIDRDVDDVVESVDGPDEGARLGGGDVLGRQSHAVPASVVDTCVAADSDGVVTAARRHDRSARTVRDRFIV